MLQVIHLVLAHQYIIVERLGSIRSRFVLHHDIGTSESSLFSIHESEQLYHVRSNEICFTHDPFLKYKSRTKDSGSFSK